MVFTSYWNSTSMTQKDYEEFLTIPMPDFKVKIDPPDFIESPEKYNKVSVIITCITGIINPDNKIEGVFEFAGKREFPFQFSTVVSAIENAFRGLMDEKYIEDLRSKISTSFDKYLTEKFGRFEN